MQLNELAPVVGHTLAGSGRASRGRHLAEVPRVDYDPSKAQMVQRHFPCDSKSATDGDDNIINIIINTIIIISLFRIIGSFSTTMTMMNIYRHKSRMEWILDTIITKNIP